MIQLELSRDLDEYAPGEVADAMHIVEIFHKRGYVISIVDALDAWQAYSSSVCAGWIILPEYDEDIFELLYPKFRVAR